VRRPVLLDRAGGVRPESPRHAPGQRPGSGEDVVDLEAGKGDPLGDLERVEFDHQYLRSVVVVISVGVAADQGPVTDQRQPPREAAERQLP